MTNLTFRLPHRFLRALATWLDLTPINGCGKSASTMRVDGVGRWRRCGWPIILLILSVGAAQSGCADEAPRRAGGGTLAGQVVVSGPLRGAAISVDQLDPAVKSSVAIRAHVGDTTSSDKDGSFELDVDTYSGLLLVTAKGGAFTDLT